MSIEMQRSVAGRNYNECLKGSVPTGNFAEPRLTAGAFAFSKEHRRRSASEPITDVPSLARRVPRGGRISLRGQPCRKVDAWGIPESQFAVHCGAPKIEICPALPLSGDS